MHPQSEGSEGGSPERLYHVTVVAGNSGRDGSSQSSTQDQPAPPHSPAHAAAHAHAAYTAPAFCPCEHSSVGPKPDVTSRCVCSVCA